MLQDAQTMIRTPSHRWLSDASRGALALLLLGLVTACGIIDSGGSQGEPPGDAGADQTVEAGETVLLQAGTTDGIATFAWTQDSGPTVQLVNADTARTSFVAPTLRVRATLVFTLTTQDEFGAMNTDQVQVTINLRPVANAGLNQSALQGDTVTLDGSASVDPDGTLPSTGFAWRQIAGATVTLNGADTAAPTFTVPLTAPAGQALTFRLTVIDSDGARDIDTVDVIVGANLPPIARAGLNQNATEGDPVTLNGSASSDPEGRPLVFQWVQTLGPVVALSGADTAAPSFTAPDVAVRTRLTFQLTVTDDAGLTASEPVSVNVIPIILNVPPTANAGLNQAVDEGDTVVLNGNGSTDSDGIIVQLSWVQTAGPSVALIGATTTTPSFTAPTGPATLVFSLTVTDDDGATDSDSVAVSVAAVNAAPVANDDSATTSEGVAVPIAVTDNDTDADGVIIRSTLTNTNPANGTAVHDGNGTVTYTPAANFNGSDSFNYRVRDNDNALSNVATVTITVTAVNDPPVANDDSAATAEGVAAVIDVAANDTDSDGVVVRSTVTVTDPPNGTAVHNGNGTVTYTPAANFNGSDSFNYRVRDNDNALSNVATVTITVNAVNDPPSANPDTGSISGTALSTRINVVANDTDPDGAADINPVSVAIDTGSSFGTVTPNGDGTVTYTQTTPDIFGNPQPDSFSYTVADAAGLRSNAASVTISVSAALTTASACWTSAPGATLTGRLRQEWAGLTKSRRYSLVNRGAKGAVTITDPRTGAFSYTPGLAESGSDHFTYRVQDASGQMRQGEVSVVIGPKLMPLGDSITAGVVNGAQQLPVPEARVGYRAPLQRQLLAAGYQIDFVGSQAFGAGMPNFDYQSEAHLQHAAAEIARGSIAKDLSYPESGIYAWLEANPADFVLMHVTPHNLNTANAAAVETILDEIDRFERDHQTGVHVFLARVVDRKPQDPRITTYNDQVEAMTQARVANPIDPDRITVVDQQGALSSPADLHDSRHPTPAGYSKMAQAWFKAIRSTCRPGVPLN